MSIFPYYAVNGTHEGRRFAESIQILDHLHLVWDGAVKPLEAHGLGTLHCILKAVEGDTIARRRVAYDELLASQVALALVRRQQKKSAGRATAGDGRLRHAIASALPFTVALLCSMWGLLKALRLDATKQGLRYQALSISPSAAPTAGGWQRRLRTLMLFPRRAHVVRFIAEVVRPAYEAIAEEMRKQGYEVEISEGEDRRLRFEIAHEGEPDFIYEVRPRAYAMPSFVVTTSEDDEREDRKYFRAEVHLAEGSQDYDLMGYTKEQIINDMLDQYERHLQFLHLVR